MAKASGNTNRPITKDSTRKNKIRKLNKHLSKGHPNDKQASSAVERLRK